MVAFPNVNSLSTPNGYNVSIQASGTSGPNGTGTPSEVDLSHVTTLTGTTNNVIFFNAYAGAKLDLSHLSSNPSGRNYFQVNGTGSVLDLSSLPTIVSDQANNSLLSVTSGGSLLAPLLTTLTRTDLTIDGSAIIPTGQFTSYTGATITVNSGTPNFSGLTSISGNQVFANGGAVVAFPNVTSLSTPNGYNVSIQASGTSGPNGTGNPSEIDLSHVTTLTGTTNNVIFFNAYAGAKLDLSHLSSNPSGRNFFQVNGSGSVLELSMLATVISDQPNDSQINVGSGGTLVDPLLTSLNRTDLSVDGTGIVSTAQITSISGSQVFATGGAVIAFPGVTALATFNGGSVAIQASGTSGTGAPSEVDLSHVTTLTGTTNNVIFFNAYAGAKLDLSHLSSNPSGRNFFQVSGSGSVLELSMLATVISDQPNDSQINVGSGGTLVDPLLTSLNRTDLSVDGTGIVSTAQITSISGSQVFATGGAVIAFPGVTALATFNGGSVTIQASGTSGTGAPSEVDLSHVTTLTGTTNNVIFFNAYAGAKLDLSHLSSNPSGRNFFQVSGSGSVLELSMLATVISDQPNDSQINVGSGGTLVDPLLTSLNRTDLSVDGTGIVSTAQITSISGSQVVCDRRGRDCLSGRHRAGHFQRRQRDDSGQRHERDRCTERGRPLTRHNAYRHDQQCHLLQCLCRREARPQPPVLEPFRPQYLSGQRHWQRPRPFGASHSHLQSAQRLADQRRFIRHGLAQSRDGRPLPRGYPRDERRHDHCRHLATPAGQQSFGQQHRPRQRRQCGSDKPWRQRGTLNRRQLYAIRGRRSEHPARRHDTGHTLRSTCS